MRPIGSSRTNPTPLLSQYHWIAHHPVKTFNMNEATITCGEDPDYAKRDLYETIAKGGNVKWTMKVQVSRSRWRYASVIAAR